MNVRRPDRAATLERVELVLVPFVLPLLLLGRLLDLFERHRAPPAVDEGAWRRTWFSFHGRPRLADRAPDPAYRVSDGDDRVTGGA